MKLLSVGNSLGSVPRKRMLTTFANSLILLFANCLIISAQQFPAQPEVKNIIQPARLNRDTTVLVLTDYFISPAKIDSITVPGALRWHWNKKDNTLTLVSGNNVHPLEDLKLWCKGAAYSVLLEKSEKALYTFHFNPKGKSYKTVQLAGELNDWNPKRTPFQLKNGIWEAQIELNPGTYQYQVVVDGKWMLDPSNPDSVDNNNGGFNSIFKTGNDDAGKPVLQTSSILPGGFSIKGYASSSQLAVNAYWENFEFGGRYMKNSGDSLIISIPAVAKTMDRSCIRVYARDDKNISNDLLIPLQHGEVLKNASGLTRNDKQADCIYFVLVDRFMDGDSSNDKPVVDARVKPKANYYGGDLAGVLDKINDGYFQSLYMNTLWISPILQNPETAFKEFPEPHDWYTGYHGYWPIALTTIDHRFGNDSVFQRLVNAAHKNHMNVLVDLVANHVHEDYPLIKQHPEWRTQLDLPDGRKNIRLWDEYRLTTWFDTFLPTLDFTNPQVVKLEVDSSVYWVQKFGIDGFRHDATKHISLNFWRALTLDLKKKIEFKENKPLYQLGETYGSKELIGSYIGSGMLDGQFDFNLYFDARAVFARDDVPFDKLTGTLNSSISYYGSHHLMGNISGNHDQPRFISLAGGALSFNEDARKAGWDRNVGVGSDTAYNKLSCLIAFIATIPGVPVLYYGDEIGMPGAGDPDNRRMMIFDHLTEKQAWLKETVTKLFKLRREHLSLTYGDFEWLRTGKYTMAYKRSYFKETTLVVFNNDIQPQTIDLRDSDDNLKIAKAQFGSKFNVNGNHLSVEVPAKSFEVFIIGNN